MSELLKVIVRIHINKLLFEIYILGDFFFFLKVVANQFFKNTKRSEKGLRELERERKTIN
jgi:hypothetical protein